MLGEETGKIVGPGVEEGREGGRKIGREGGREGGKVSCPSGGRTGGCRLGPGATLLTFCQGLDVLQHREHFGFETLINAASQQ